MEKLHKSSISVTDISSQYWCELKMELNHLYGEERTAEMRKGLDVHEELESKINLPIELEPRSYSDALYKTLYTNCEALEVLKKNKKTREFKIYGSVNGFRVSGKIDELNMMGNETAIIEDKTMSRGKNGDRIQPNEAKRRSDNVQVMLYKRLLDDMTRGRFTLENFTRNYRTRTLKITNEFKLQLDTLKIENSMQSIDSIARRFFESATKIAPVSNVLQIRYIDQFTGELVSIQKFNYSSDEANNIIKFAFKYWNGERSALPVPSEERWKCTFCYFYGRQCKVWWPPKEQRLLSAK